MQSARSAPGEAENWLLECFCSSLCPSVPTDAGTDRRRGLSCPQRITRETGSSGGRMKAFKFLMRSLVFSQLKLHTSCLWAGWNNQAHHATHTDKLPPLAPPHASVCHHSRCVPSPCFSGDMRNSVSPPPLFILCLYSSEVGGWSAKASRGLLSRKIDLLHKNILPLSSVWKRSPRQCRRSAAGEALACCLLCGLGMHSLSGLHVFQSCVCAWNDNAATPHPPPPQPRRQTQGEVQTRALPVRLCKDRIWGWRKWFWSDWFIAVTPFLWIMRSCEHFRGRPVQNTFRGFAKILKCELFWRVKQEYVLYSSWDGRWGSWWVGGITRRWLVHPT